MASPEIDGASAGVIHRVLTDNRGGVSEGDFASFNLGDHVGDDPVAVATNRRRLADSIGLLARQLVWMDQVHGTHVVRVDRPTGGPVPATDALVTAEPNLALVVLTADCVPILAADHQAGIIGAAHAGRKGATGGIAGNLIDAMCALGAATDRIEVLLGPAASGSCYELPDDLASQVEHVLPGSRTRTTAGTAGVDLRTGLTQQLHDLGVATVVSDPRCTISDENLFSYRRSGRTGRQASLIWRRL